MELNKINLTEDEATTILEAIYICHSEGLSPPIVEGVPRVTEINLFDKIVAKYPGLFKQYIWLADEYRKHYRNYYKKNNNI